jgi:hypothetical protein
MFKLVFDTDFDNWHLEKNERPGKPIVCKFIRHLTVEPLDFMGQLLVVVLLVPINNIHNLN